MGTAHMSTEQTSTAYAEQATRLVARVDQDGWGSVRPSLYETARVISAAPWLPGEPRRLDYLLQAQAPDGSWGEGPEPYRLLPTLSAVEAALAVLLRGAGSDQVGARLRAAVEKGIAALRLLPSAGPWPDTAAAELLVPSLVSRINEQLDLAATEGLAGLGPWQAGPRLAVPGGYHEAAPGYVAQRYEAAGRLPVKFHHTFEGIAAHLAPVLIPEAQGLLGSSPAATAALAAASPTGAATARAAAELGAVAQRYDGLFPEAAPILVFERLWVAAALARAGLPAATLPTIRGWVERIYDPAGVRGAPGLMVDADDTAMAVLVAALVGRPQDPRRSRCSTTAATTTATSARTPGRSPPTPTRCRRSAATWSSVPRSSTPTAPGSSSWPPGWSTRSSPRGTGPTSGTPPRTTPPNGA